MSDTVIDELGDGVELLVQPDHYLDSYLSDLADTIDRLRARQETALRARRAKRALQQRNQVAVRLLQRNAQNQVVSSIIRAMPLPDAVQLLRRRIDSDDVANVETQFYVWRQDGYDLVSSAALRAAEPGNEDQ